MVYIYYLIIIIHLIIKKKYNNNNRKTKNRVISLHPTKDIFWIMAASWEFEKNGNALSGRTLLQRGLRINGESKKLWLEYFRLELLYLEKLRERRKILFGKTNENNEESTENGEDEDSKVIKLKYNKTYIYNIILLYFKNILIITSSFYINLYIILYNIYLI